MHRKLKKSAAVVLALIAALIIGLIFFLNRPRTAPEPETDLPMMALTMYRGRLRERRATWKRLAAKHQNSWGSTYRSKNKKEN